MTDTHKFSELEISEELLHSVHDLGYESLTPVQDQSIPILLNNDDIVAEAQTGTGKTAAFALPILERLNLKKYTTQALVLAPTRELAIQVAEAFQKYAKYLKNFHVLPIYGGQEYGRQLKALRNGVHVVVGTPGRVMDHMRRGTLTLENIKTLVLDEADEMLNMGFLEDVEWILEHMQQKHQTALFSATMPKSIIEVSKKYLNNAKHIKIENKTVAASGILQKCMIVSADHKFEALTRYLEIEEADGILIFSRTKTMTVEIADRLSARGYSALALNGDMNQRAREDVIRKIKACKIDIIVATDVAARGLDVTRLSHVINYDAPFDIETYIHRIGRTGRAGRTGKSLLMITPREQRYLRDLERTTKQKIELISPPTIQELKESRVDDFISKLLNILNKDELDYYKELIETIAHKHEHSELDIAAALLKIAQSSKPFKVKGKELPVISRDENPMDRSRPRGRGRSRSRSNSRSNSRSSFPSRRDRSSNNTSRNSRVRKKR